MSNQFERGTTKRILSTGTRWKGGSPSFVSLLNRNNPRSSFHWLAAISNNPGGIMPELNPDWFVEALDNARKAINPYPHPSDDTNPFEHLAKVA